MTIEINKAQSPWIYRISPIDPLLVERRHNKRGARWLWYLHRDTPAEAKAALLQLGKEEEKR